MSRDFGGGSSNYVLVGRNVMIILGTRDAL